MKKDVNKKFKKMIFNVKDSIINSIEVVLMNLHEKEKKMYQRLIILTLLICMVIYYFEKIVDFWHGCGMGFAFFFLWRACLVFYNILQSHVLFNQMV